MNNGRDVTVCECTCMDGLLALSALFNAIKDGDLFHPPYATASAAQRPGTFPPPPLYYGGALPVRPLYYDHSMLVHYLGGPLPAPPSPSAEWWPAHFRIDDRLLNLLYHYF